LGATVEHRDSVSLTVVQGQGKPASKAPVLAKQAGHATWTKIKNNRYALHPIPAAARRDHDHEWQVNKRLRDR
jgi:hypothetical protein